MQLRKNGPSIPDRNANPNCWYKMHAFSSEINESFQKLLIFIYQAIGSFAFSGWQSLYMNSQVILFSYELLIWIPIFLFSIQVNCIQILNIYIQWHCQVKRWTCQRIFDLFQRFLLDEVFWIISLLSKEVNHW